MPRHFISLAVGVALILSAAGCKKTPAENLEEKKKQFQARQRTEAVKNYREIIAKYPDSPFAAQAQERLRALNAPEQAPSKK